MHHKSFRFTKPYYRGPDESRRLRSVSLHPKPVLVQPSSERSLESAAMPLGAVDQLPSVVAGTVVVSRYWDSVTAQFLFIDCCARQINRDTFCARYCNSRYSKGLGRMAFFLVCFFFSLGIASKWTEHNAMWCDYAGIMCSTGCSALTARQHCNPPVTPSGRNRGVETSLLPLTTPTKAPRGALGSNYLFLLSKYLCCDNFVQNFPDDYNAHF